MASWLTQLTRILAILSLLATFGASTPALASSEADGFVYTLTNAAAGNRVLIFDRGTDGTLTAAGSVATGGNGGPLGSQGALAMSVDGHWLYAVNAGSNTVSLFSIDNGALTLTDVVASGGTGPNSVTSRGSIVYVLNAGAMPNISGFERTGGQLSPISGSTRLLGRTDAGAVEVAFAPSGRILVVSDKAANTVETFVVDSHGVAGGPNLFPSSGPAPFGFAFGQNDVVVFSEAASIPPGSSSASSYTVTRDGSLTAVSASITTTQGAACWLAVTDNGRWAYTANAASGSLSLFAIAKDSGALTLQDATAATGLAHPTDMALTRSGHMLYVLAAGSIAGYRVGADGTLSWISSTPMAGSAGLVAR